MINGLIGQCISPNTLQIYMRGLTCLDDFRSQFSLAYVWPVSVQELCNFIAHLILAKYSHSTIKSYLSGISFFQKLNGFEDTTQSFIVKKLLKGINRSKPKIKDAQLPITRDMLKAISTISGRFMSYFGECCQGGATGSDVNGGHVTGSGSDRK